MAIEEYASSEDEDTEPDHSLLAATYAAAQMERERKAHSEAMRAQGTDPDDYLEDTELFF